MVRFSCFHSSVHCPKPKKTVQMSTEAMQKTLEDYSENEPKKDLAPSTEVLEDHLSNNDDTNQSPSSVVQDWKSEGFKSVNDTVSDEGTPQVRAMRKSLSLGSVLVEYKGKISGDECSAGESSSSHNNHSESRVLVDDKDPGNHKADSLELSSNMVNHESVFSLGYQQQSEKEACENSETRFSGEGTGCSSSHTPPTPHTLAKSGSSPYFFSSLAHLRHQSRSSEDLKALGLRRKDRSISNVETQLKQYQERDIDHLGNTDKSNAEIPADDGDDAYQFVGSAKDWIIPGVDELRKGKNVQEDYSVNRWDELPNKDFKIKRIEKWVMDLQHCPLEETNAQTNSSHRGLNDNGIGLDVLTTSKTDGKAVIGMDAAKRYISSLSASATAAQLTNHGLVVIPYLSVFASLKALNLSGNAILRITAGALPRGLHILNLSKNNISTIEGLRELTRLRVLDLSYNKLIRIGHGLASCSSLKELYLAGNKISEVEGLHRLLKLNVLDLRFNKLSTTKSLGQLAANYNSLQAISLEGNPAQKNIGDEHLKKHLLSLLPHLAYFNRQSIKAGSTKDSADRAARLGISAHQIDRGLRSDSKGLRKSTHGRKGHQAASASRSKHMRLPPAGIKTAVDRQHFNDLSSKLFSFRPDALRRTRSEEVLGAI